MCVCVGVCSWGRMVSFWRQGELCWISYLVCDAEIPWIYISLSLYIVYCNRITVKLKWGEKLFEWKPCDLGIHSHSSQYHWQLFFPPLRLFLCTAPTWAPSISAAPAFDYTCLCTKWKSILFTMFRWHFKMTFILKNWAGKAKHPINCWFCALRRF